jgi:hypothetical protein
VSDSNGGGLTGGDEMGWGWTLMGRERLSECFVPTRSCLSPKNALSLRLGRSDFHLRVSKFTVDDKLIRLHQQAMRYTICICLLFSTMLSQPMLSQTYP